MSRVRAELLAQGAQAPSLGHASGDSRVDYRGLGFYIPDLTVLTGWDWQPVQPPEPEHRPVGFVTHRGAA